MNRCVSPLKKCKIYCSILYAAKDTIAFSAHQMATNNTNTPFGQLVTDVQALNETLRQLEKQDPVLKTLFAKVPSLNWSALRKSPYVALIGAIIGQRVSLPSARKSRRRLYLLLGGSDFTREQVDQLTDQQLQSDIGLDAHRLVAIRAVNRFLAEKYVFGLLFVRVFFCCCSTEALHWRPPSRFGGWRACAASRAGRSTTHC